MSSGASAACGDAGVRSMKICSVLLGRHSIPGRDGGRGERRRVWRPGCSVGGSRIGPDYGTRTIRVWKTRRKPRTMAKVGRRRKTVMTAGMISLCHDRQSGIVVLKQFQCMGVELNLKAKRSRRPLAVCVAKFSRALRRCTTPLR